MKINQKVIALFSSYLQLWGLYILFYIIVGVASFWFPELQDGTYEQTSIREMIDNNPLKLIILACVFAPIVEEMMFRTLIKPTHTDILLFISAWPIFIGMLFINLPVHWALSMGASFILLFIVYFILKKYIPSRVTQSLRSFLNRYPWSILFIMACIFGIVHISNYVDDFIINTALILLIIPRVLSGFMMGIIKIKNQGLIWAMALHFLNNSIVAGLMLL